MSTPVGSDLTTQDNDLQTVGADLSSDAGQADEQAINAGFIFDMDLALRDHLKGIKVFDRESGGVRSNGNPGRQVFVYFANGETEVQDRTWPFITVTLVGFRRASEREHRGTDPTPNFTYTVGGVNLRDPAARAAHTMEEWPIPYDFTWLVQAHSRNFQHDRQLQLALEQDDKIPTRFGYLPVNDTIRILTRDSGPVQTDFLAGAPPKRVFRKTYTVSATAEFYRSDLEQLSTVQHVDIGTIAII